MAKGNRGPSAQLREQYPGLTDETLEQLDETWDRYIGLVLRIHERVRQDPDAYARFKTLTASAQARTIEVEQSP